MAIFKRRSSPNPDFWRLKEGLIWSFRLGSCVVHAHQHRPQAWTWQCPCTCCSYRVPTLIQKALFVTSSLCWTPAWINHKQDIDTERIIESKIRCIYHISIISWYEYIHCLAWRFAAESLWLLKWQEGRHHYASISFFPFTLQIAKR